MRIPVTVPAILLAGLALSGCVASTGPVGVLPRDPVPLPPSLSGEAPQRAGSQGVGSTAQRRALSVPGQAASRRP
jgi:hypothetical protein